MATTSISDRTINEAAQMAQNGHTWHKGRSKTTGRPFYLIPSRSVPNTAHRCTHYGCTCTGFKRRGDCIHTEAVRLFENQQQAPKRKSYAALHGFCDALNCQSDREPSESYCSRHILIDAF